MLLLLVDCVSTSELVDSEFLELTKVDDDNNEVEEESDFVVVIGILLLLLLVVVIEDKVLSIGHKIGLVYCLK